MNEELIKQFVRQSEGKLLHRIKKMKQVDPSERIYINHEKTREIFDKAGLSKADYSLWRDKDMLDIMQEITKKLWTELNYKNLIIEEELEEEIVDNRDQLNWQDISLTWEEAEEIAAEEYVKQMNVQSSISSRRQENQADVEIKLLTYEKMREDIQRASNGNDNEAIRQATYRAIKRALDDQLEPPIPIGGCAKGYSIQEINKPLGKEKSWVKACKYIHTKEAQA